MGSGKAPLSESEKQVLYHMAVTRLPTRAMAERMGVSVKYVYHLLRSLGQRRARVDWAVLEAEWRAAGLLPGDQS